MSKFYDDMLKGNQMKELVKVLLEKSGYTVLPYGYESTLSDMKKKLKKTRGELETIEDLSNTLHKLFREHGKTLDRNYMVFTWGGKSIMSIRCDSELWKYVKLMEDTVDSNKLDMTEEMKKVLKGYKYK